ncbi:MAG TPA: hydroxyacylglutathione hydrolase [Sedimenticola thiotaurini]|uniref:Hydroxyacylglutathione hydrolase n=1 Tax=Sedimenticola thiotaurini TaxID=1543721 RepID=A0A831RLN1_9GAMM|nr:hydroxyacylglutathione hydrolase [Sedimenticola thiotaurini]
MPDIDPIPAFDDNYIWLLSRPDAATAVVVDPGDEDPVMETLQRRGLALEAILVTHKHGDHVGGIDGLLEAWPGIPVYGPAAEPIRRVTRPLGDGDRVDLPGLGLTLQVLEVPGHTEGHLAYVGDGALFCGDTLFAAGCGRVFSGTHEQLHHSLQRLAALPPSTRVFCAHEYTLANLGFALWVEPDSTALRERLQRERARRDAGEPTVPSTLELELQTNPFLRTGEAAVIAAAERYAGGRLEDGAGVFTAIRNWKDREYD